jgi:hypothetical protein
MPGYLTDYEWLIDCNVLRFPALLSRELLKINKLIVDAAGIEPR